MKLLGDLERFAAVAIQAGVLVAVSTGMVLPARSSLPSFDGDMHWTVDHSARRAVLDPQAAVAVDASRRSRPSRGRAAHILDGFRREG